MVPSPALPAFIVYVAVILRQSIVGRGKRVPGEKPAIKDGEATGGAEDPGRREVLKKAAYTAPALICIGVLYPVSAGGAQSCESSPLGCPPDPPGQAFPQWSPDTFPFDDREKQ